MRSYRYALVTGVIILIGEFIFGQSDLLKLKNSEKNLKDTYQKIFTEPKNHKDSLEKAFANLFCKTLQNSDTQFYTFDSLKNIGRIKSENNDLIIYSWNIPDNFGFSNYYCIIQYFSKKETFTWQLIEHKKTNNQTAFLLSSASDWYGCLYYELIENKFKGRHYYTLLGYNFNNVLSNKKLIEVITINDQNEIEFVPGMFVQNGQVINRPVFEFAEQARMTLRFDPVREIIIYDHLAPERPSLQDQFQFYGPDGSYDGFKFKEGKWQHLSDIKFAD